VRKLVFTKDALNFVDRLDAKQFRQVVRKCLSLIENPRPHDSIHMTGRSDFRTDVGEYRIVYLFDDATVTIEVIGKRNDNELYKKGGA
jgi:mRNA interferase RelE/StbE